jgi:TolB-like protein/DNA-binding winged helix-turn-helix (wHTH) protein
MQVPIDSSRMGAVMRVPPKPDVVRFGAFEFDTASGDLRREGRRVRLQTQPRLVLGLLVARRGELVTREELRRQLWAEDTFVDFDNGLNVAIRKIRDALGDAAPTPLYVETERGRGYRFVASVVDGAPAAVDDAEALPPDASGAVHGPAPGSPHRSRGARSRLVAAALALATVAGAGATAWRAGVLRSSRSTPREAGTPITLAVLPLESAGGQPDDLALGIPDAIITRLSSVRQFRVRPTSAVAGYLRQQVDAQEVGRRLGALYVLAGSLRGTAGRLRVSVQLVRTTDGATIWGRQYDVARRELLGVEDAVAADIASALRVQMSNVERERLYRRATRSGAAYEHYLVGRARLRALTERGALEAIEEFEAARGLDPSYALAYAGLATAAAQLRVRFGSSRDYEGWDSRARREARRALELDPDLAEAYEALAAVHRFQEFDWDSVLRESRRALELNPSLDRPHLYAATAYFHIGLLQAAETEVRAALELNPERRVEPLEILAAIHLFAGRFQDALDCLSQVRDLSDSRIVRYLFGWTLYYADERQRAEALLGSMAAEEGPLPNNARATLAAFRAARGEASEARLLASRVAVEPHLNHHAAYGLGAAYAQLGEPATALRWLSQAAATGFSCYPWYRDDPLLDPLRDEPRFVAFIGQLRRSWEFARSHYAVDAPASAGPGTPGPRASVPPP